MTSHHSSSGPSQRQLRVGEQIKHILAESLQRGHFHDERLLDIGGKISVTEVRPSPDLKHATAYIIALGGGELGDLLDALNEEAHIFQKDINRGSNLKFTPKVRFVTDKSFEQSKRIDELLHEIHYAEENEE